MLKSNSSNLPKKKKTNKKEEKKREFAKSALADVRVKEKVQYPYVKNLMNVIYLK